MRDVSTIAKMRPSPIRRIYEKAIQMDDVVFFSLGEPDFNTPPQVVEAAMESLRRGETHYTPNAGLPALREAIADNLREYDGVAYDPLSHVDPDITLRAEARPIGGLGILMVKKMASSVSYRRAGDHNRFTIVHVMKGK